MFRKPGRPPEDRLERRREIWGAVGPLIEKHGARSLTMRKAAAAAFMSIGCLYYYFPSKQSLVLFGLDEEATERACAEFATRYGYLSHSDPPAATEALISFIAGRISFVRPSVLAALELGAEDFMTRFEATVGMERDRFTEKLTLALPDADDRDLRLVARSLRRIRLAGVLDRSITQRELEEELRAVLSGVPVGRTKFAAAR
jgi:AcrR family transcriptional regulator